MTGKSSEQILKELANEIEVQKFEEKPAEHEFSHKYKMQKAELLKKVGKNHARTERKKYIQAAAAFLIVIGLSFTVYAAVREEKVVQAVITVNKQVKTLSLELKRKKQAKNFFALPKYLPEERFLVLPEYLPEGYEEWMQGKYSYGGVWAAAGMTIIDYYSMEKEKFEYETYEIRDIGQAKALIVKRNSGVYPWVVTLVYEKAGHVIRLWGYEGLSEEEIIKTAENLTYKEVSEEAYKEYLQQDVWSPEDDIITEDKIIQLNEKVEFPQYAKGCFLQVTDIRIEDGTVSGKNVEVEMEIENTTNQKQEELPIYPVFKCLEKELSGIRPPCDFDSSVKNNRNSIFYTELKANAKKKIHFWFEVPEGELDIGYIQLWKEYYVKVK